MYTDNPVITCATILRFESALAPNCPPLKTPVTLMMIVGNQERYVDGKGTTQGNVWPGKLNNLIGNLVLYVLNMMFYIMSMMFPLVAPSCLEMSVCLTKSVPQDTARIFSASNTTRLLLNEKAWWNITQKMQNCR